MYNVKELEEKITEKIIGLGIDPKFKDNPAFAEAISEIKGMMSQMNMGEAAQAVTVKEENNVISFSWTSPVGEKNSMSISCSNPETFKSVKTEEKKPFVATDGQTVRQKSVVEKVATIDNNNIITLTTNGSMIDDMNCGVGKCNNTTWSERKLFSADGVMKERENKGFKPGELTENFDRANENTMLYIPRQAFDNGFWYDKYDTRTLLVREKLDTARIVSENKSNGIKYNATIPLNQEHGLRDMTIPAGYNQYPQDITINPLSKEEIEDMIQKESNPKVQEGLRAYANGRENYRYNSSQDENFICEGVSESQSISR